MQTDKNFLEELKYQYNYGGMFMKLIFINVLVFLFIGLFSVVGRLSGNEFFLAVLKDIFTLQTDYLSFFKKPWGLFTSIFSHFGVFHLLLNMIMLYFAGKIFEHYLGSKRLLAIYILGGLTGGLFEILAHTIIPSMANQSVIVVGASGSIMAIFIGLAFFKPNLPISLFGLFEFKIIYLGLIYLLLDIFNLGLNDGTAHFAHLGGAINGIISANRANSSQNLVFKFEKILYKFFSFFKNLKFKSKNDVYSQHQTRKKTDEEYNFDAKQRQELTNKILDKISKSGYESLSKKEKEFLFKQSK
jgi:membrane associated rhomboid family serine protease